MSNSGISTNGRLEKRTRNLLWVGSWTPIFVLLATLIFRLSRITYACPCCSTDLFVDPSGTNGTPSAVANNFISIRFPNGLFLLVTRPISSIKGPHHRRRQQLLKDKISHNCGSAVGNKHPFNPLHELSICQIMSSNDLNLKLNTS